ncbi:phosphoenolpyruvate hydrolase family protein [Arcanobacterium haemolyticum]|nr:phosphoenolpyruvate hydrolase family protein [Arcanobacterium haemolyticum]
MDREKVLARLRAQAHGEGYLIGAAIGSGLTAKFAKMAHIDMILALSAGRYRQAGRGSYASYLCYGDSNMIVEEFGSREILPMIDDTPVFFGLSASDPNIHLPDYISHIAELGYSGVVNYPTLSLIDGNFRRALESEGTSYDDEVAAIRLAHDNGLLSLAFVTNADEARMMVDAGADILCAHLGLTRGGYLGGRQQLSLTRAADLITAIFDACDDADVIRMVYSGPAATPEDMRYLYAHTSCQGYIGGSVFDRIPSENAILQAALEFKSGGDKIIENLMRRLHGRRMTSSDHVDFIKQYISENYSLDIHLTDIASILHISHSRLSTIFSSEMGVTFTEYLIYFRLDIAKDLLRETDHSIKQIAASVGYRDPVQFSKTFKKKNGMSPREYRELSAA